jgi:lysozyme family protein
MDFAAAFTKLLGHEGGYSNHPADPGGETMWGITIAVARANGYRGAMKDMPVSEARRIYLDLYWRPLKLDQLPASIRFDMFDTGVNAGVSRAVKLLQRTLRLTEDGVLGPKTIAAANAANPEQLDAALAGHRLLFLCDLKTFPSFGKGWVRRVAHNLIED